MDVSKDVVGFGVVVSSVVIELEDMSANISLNGWQ